MPDNVQIPIELKPIIAALEKSLAQAKKSVSNLEKTVEDLNKSLEQAGGPKTRKSFDQLIKKLDETNKSLNKINQTQQKNLQEVQETNDSIFKSYEDVRAAVIDVVSALQFLEENVLPIAEAFLDSSQAGSEFKAIIIGGISEVRRAVVKGIADIQDALFNLFKAKTRIGFLIQLVRLNRTVGRSLNEVQGALQNTRDDVERLTFNFSDLASTGAGVGVSLFTILRAIGIGRSGFQLYNAAVADVNKELTGLARFGAVISSLFRTITRSAASSVKEFGAFAKSAGPIEALSRLVKGEISAAFKTLAGVIGEGVGPALRGLISGFGEFASRSNFLKFLRDIGGAFGVALKETELFSKSIFGSITRIEASGVALNLLGQVLKNSSNSIVAFTGDVLELVGIALAPLGFALNLLIIRVGDFVLAVGNRLVAANLRAADSFATFERQTFVFDRTLRNFRQAFPELIKDATAFERAISRLNQTTGASIGNLRSAATILIETGAVSGLTEQQILFLLDASTDLAAQIKGDLTQAALDLTGAFLGNVQAVQKYGLNLGEAAAKQFLLEKNIRSNFNTLDETAKAQVRFNLFLKQFEVISGVAAETTQTLSGTAELLESRLQDVSVAFGRGTNLVESYSIGQRALIGLIDSLNPAFFTLAGALSAVTGRIVQGTGFLLKFGFALVLIRTSLQAINTLLVRLAAAGFFTKTLPLINLSFVELAKNAGVVNASFDGLVATLKTFGAVGVAQSKRVVAALAGVEVAALSVQSVLIGVAKRIGLALKAVAAFFLLNPLGIALAAGLVAGLAFSKILQTIEDRTKALSVVFSAVGEVFSAVLGAFFGDSIRANGVIKTLSDTFGKTLGLAVRGVVFLLKNFIDILKTVPRRFISQETVNNLEKTQVRLLQLNKQLIGANNNLFKIGGNLRTTSRALNTGFNPNNLQEVRLELEKIRQATENIGKSTLQQISDELVQRQRVVRAAIENNLVTEQEAQELLRKIRLDAFEKTEEEKQKLLEESLKRQTEITERALADPLRALFGGGEGQLIGAVGLTGNILGGGGGAQELVSNFIGGVFETIIPGLGQAASEIIDILAQGPEKVRETVQEFVRAIPDIIVNIVQAIPVLIEELVKAIPLLIEALIQSLDEIVLALARLMPKVIVALIQALPQLITALVNELPKVIIELAKQMPQIAVDFVKALVSEAPKFIEALIELLPGGNLLTGGEGDGGGILSGIPLVGDVLGGVSDFVGSILPFQSGGLVPRGFNNDNFFARLSSGELVIDRSLTSRLENFLSDQESPTTSEGEGGATNLTVNLRIGEKELANVLLDLNRRGFRTA